MANNPALLVCGVGFDPKSLGHHLKDHTPLVMQAHTAAHLFYESAKKVLAPDLVQCGATVSPKAFIMDISWTQPLTAEQKAAIEKEVNDFISSNYEVTMETLTPENARELGIITPDAEEEYKKANKEVKVCSIGAGGKFVSRKVCAGWHAVNTSELGKFTIDKDEEGPTKVRRISASIG